LSLLGFRTFFEFIYYKSGVVSSNLIGVKSLGMYRVWGLIGSPQVLGIFHVITLIYLLDRKENFWAILCIVAIIASTSKTAYIILLIYAFIYMLQKKHYIALMFSLFFIVSAIIISIGFYLYIIDHALESDYPHFTKFIGSIHGYFILLTNTAMEVASEKEKIPQPRFLPGGSLYEFLTYFINNPQAIIAGKGITYSIYQDTSSMAIADYHYLTSDYYLLSFTQQYGLIGLMFVIYIFLIYPFLKLCISKKLYYGVPIIFFLATLHYPPNISKLFMIFMSYSLYKIYITKDHVNEK